MTLKEEQLLFNQLDKRFDDLNKYFDLKFDILKEEIKDLKDDNKHMVDNCVYKDIIIDTKNHIKKIDEELFFYRVIAKYKRTAIITLTGIVFIGVMQMYNLFFSANNNKQLKEIVNTEEVAR